MHSIPHEDEVISLPAEASSREVEQKFNRLEKSASSKNSRLVIDGFEDLFLRSGLKKREKLASLVAALKADVIFKDGFPFSKKDLALRESMREYFSLPNPDEVKRNISFVPRAGMTPEEITLRNEWKRKQSTAFDDPWLEIKAAILPLKALRVPESEIVKELKNRNVHTINGKPIPQATINRLFHEFKETFRNLQPPVEKAGHFYAMGGILLKDSPVPKGPKLDRSTKEWENPFAPLRFNHEIKLRFQSGTITEEGVYLGILNREGAKVEALHFPSSTVKDNYIRIEALVDTVLIPGYYEAFVFNSSAAYQKGEWSDQFAFTLGEEKIKRVLEENNVRFVPDHRGDFILVPVS
ncbi:hypothetical protein QWY85_04910 [Neolewinella lacunae]|uniref:Uncharacterized protein n=1 Tax=Neolewinella lacunae TaxID=1517758 RepID=A0A923PQX6_9BACT|nr:hypothetical protein [Neolewinella lacunae]MBC6996136.1 hypothetical protein [Neolewinella lacunae]MDN3633989.1 hypothetical protein [Neolewinella lacunae]